MSWSLECEGGRGRGTLAILPANVRSWVICHIFNRPGVAGAHPFHVRVMLIFEEVIFITLESPALVLPFSCRFQNCFGFKVWTYFSGRRKLLTTLNHNVPPYEKNLKNVQMLFLIALKKHPDALNATQKTQLFTTYGV